MIRKTETVSYQKVRDLKARLKDEADILRDAAANLEDAPNAEDVVEGAAEDIDGVIRRLTGFKADIAAEPEIERWETVRWTETVESDDGEPESVELAEQVPITRDSSAPTAGRASKPAIEPLTEEVHQFLGRLHNLLDRLRGGQGSEAEATLAMDLFEVAGQLESLVGQRLDPDQLLASVPSEALKTGEKVGSS
jgi:hypothetical protein